MQAVIVISTVIAFLIALYELSWISESSLGIVLVLLALVVGFQGIVLYNVLESKGT